MGVRNDSARGMLLGLAVGDALGTAVEFSPRGRFVPVVGMRGGGAFGLEPGQWTDDTSMALCLAESLIERRVFDPVDQLQRYLRWYQTGHLSVTGECFDIGRTTRLALEKFRDTGLAFCGPQSEDTAGNGSIMRLAPVVIAHAHDHGRALHLAGESSRTTHGAPQAIDGCRVLAAVMLTAVGGAERGQSRLAVLERAIDLLEGSGHWAGMRREIRNVMNPGLVGRGVEGIHSSGYVVHTLEAALWAFLNGNSFEESALMAVNLGDDADTVGAVCGQLAGAYWGVRGIPEGWLEELWWCERIEDMADRLTEISSK